MNTVLLGSVGLLLLISGCVSSSAVSTREAARVTPPVRSLAPEETREFHIAAGEAPAALNEFSRQSNKQVLFDYRSLRERQTRAVEGTLPPAKALQAMLKDTGLVADDVNERTVAIMPGPSADSAH